MMTGRTHVDVVEAKREAREADKEIQMSLREQMLIEALTELHAQYVQTINPRNPHCQLTTRAGLLKTPELGYIEEHGCPVCSKPSKGDPTSPAQRVLDALNTGAPSSHAPEPTPNTGPEMKIAEEHANLG